MERKTLECGHVQPVKLDALATWCPVCNEMALVRPEDRSPVSAGTRAALALATR